jgi:hypothetical protein
MQKGSRGTQCERSRGACMSTSRKVETTILAVASSAIFMHLCTNSTTLQSSRHHMRFFDGCFYGLDYVVLLWSGLWSADACIYDASVGHLFPVTAIVITIQDSTSSRLLPGSICSCCIRNLHALVHKYCHPVNITTAKEIMQGRIWQLCKSTLPPNHSGC